MSSYKDNKSRRNAFAVMVRNDPKNALQVLTTQDPSDQPNMMEDAILEIGDDAKAVDLIGETILAPEQAGILALWGDRASAFAQLASPEAIAEGLRRLCEDGRGKDDTHDDEIAFAAAAIRGLALQIHDRADWDEVLDQEYGDFTLRELLVAAVAEQVEEIDDDGSRPADAWINVGLDPEEAEKIRKGLPEDLFSQLSAENLFRARRTMSERREAAGLPSSAEGDADDA